MGQALLAVLLLFYDFTAAFDHSSGDNTLSVLLENIEKIDTQHRADISQLHAKFENTEKELIQTITELHNELYDLQKELKHVKSTDKQDTLNVLNMASGLGDGLEKAKVKKAKSSKPIHCGNEFHKRGFIQVQQQVAFTSYLDHDLNDIRTGDVIIFNEVLLNDGNGYNEQTGQFTAPVDGVYHFDFAIGERNENQIYVQLVVNDNNTVGGVAESVQYGHDSHGGNVANLKLAKGDVVCVKHDYGDHVEGAKSNKVSTFSGLLLYQTSINSIGNK